MKKLRSNLPRRKRTQCSPILKPSANLNLNPTSINDSSSNLTREAAFACDSSSRVSTNNNNNIRSVKKRSFEDGNDVVVSEFRRITRSVSKRLAEKEKGNEVKVELSETSSCVDLVDSSLKKDIIIGKGSADLRDLKTENNNNNNNNNNDDVIGMECSEVTTRSECSVFPKKVTETETAVNEGQTNNNYAESVASGFEITSVTNVTTAVNDDEQTEDCGESKLLVVESGECELKGVEEIKIYGGDDEECGDYYSSGEDEFTDENTESCEYEYDYSSDWSGDSGSQFSELNAGETVPSPTFQLFLIYGQKFCKSEFSASIYLEENDHMPAERVTHVQKMLRPEDEEHEESYWLLKKRERRQVYLRDYVKAYRRIREYGDLVVHQRSQMVRWIMERSANKEFQKETMFLGVSLYDRFLSKGYFRNKMDLAIAGIACLTLATRIEENQPYNSIRQKLFKVGGNQYSRSEVVAMEWLVQEVLNFQCYLPTIYNFLWFYLKAARASQYVAKTANYLGELALLGHEQLSYWPSTVAASLVCLACLAENQKSSHQQITWIHNGSNDKDLPDCIKSMEYLVQYIR